MAEEQQGNGPTDPQALANELQAALQALQQAAQHASGIGQQAVNTLRNPPPPPSGGGDQGGDHGGDQQGSISTGVPTLIFVQFQNDGGARWTQLFGILDGSPGMPAGYPGEFRNGQPFIISLRAAAIAAGEVSAEAVRNAAAAEIAARSAFGFRCQYIPDAPDGQKVQVMDGQGPISRDGATFSTPEALQP